MHFITMISGKNPLEEGASQRTIGYFSTKKEAIDVLENNIWGVWETLYEYAIVQDFEEGLYPDLKETIWFMCYEESGRYLQIPEPSMFSNYQFGIG